MSSPFCVVDRRNWRAQHGLWFFNGRGRNRASKRSAARDNPAQCGDECASRGVACGRCYQRAQISHGKIIIACKTLARRNAWFSSPRHPLRPPTSPSTVTDQGKRSPERITTTNTYSQTHKVPRPRHIDKVLTAFQMRQEQARRPVDEERVEGRKRRVFAVRGMKRSHPVEGIP